jgi:hypothetical protein
MKNKITFLSLAAVIVSTMSFTILSDDGRAGVTGSPDETTCNTTGCHNSFAVNTGGGSVVISAPTLNNWQYVPNQTYAITVTVSKTGLKLFGFGFEALTAAGANAGTLTAGATGTTTINAVIKGTTRTSVTHKLNGGTGTTDSHTFTFNWKAPATDIGKITFYCAGNAANGNGSATSDYIYTTSQAVHSPTSVGIMEQHEFAKQVNIYPNPAINQLQIRNESNLFAVMNVSIMDLKGQLINQQQNITSDGLLTLENINAGVYLLRIESEGKVAFKQFVKQ